MIYSALTCLVYVPVFVVVIAVVCLAVRPLRFYALAVFFVPFFAGLSLMCSLWPPNGITLPLGMIFGGTAAGWVGIPLAVVAGAWLGVVVSRAVSLSHRGNNLAFRLLILLVSVILGQLLYLLPESYWRQACEGGSGGWWSVDRETDLPHLLMKTVHRPLLQSLSRLPYFPNLWLWTYMVVVVVAQLTSLGSLIVTLWKRRTTPRTVP